MRSPRPGPGSDRDDHGSDEAADAASDDASADHAVVPAVEPGLRHPAHDAPDDAAGDDRTHADAYRQPRGLTMPNVSEHSPSYPHGTDRVVCSCGCDSGVVPGAFAWPDYDREWADNPVASVWRTHVADVTLQALTALGWRIEDSEPMAGRDFDPMPGGHWTGCSCKWCARGESR